MNINYAIKQLAKIQRQSSGSFHGAGKHAGDAISALLQLRDALYMDAHPEVNYGGDGIQSWSRSPGGVRPAVTLGEWNARMARRKS